jgi:hypothetical protein
VITFPQETGDGMEKVVVPVGFPDFRFPGSPAPEGGPRAKVRANLEAVRLLRRLRDEARELTREEQEVLARYATARLQTLDNGAPVAVFTVARELGHTGVHLVERIYGHLGEVHHRSEVVEFRSELYPEWLTRRRTSEDAIEQ